MPGGDLGSYPREVKEHRRRRGNGSGGLSISYVEYLCHLTLNCFLMYKMKLKIDNNNNNNNNNNSNNNNNNKIIISIKGGPVITVHK